MFVSVPVSRLTEEPYASLICYPKATSDEIQARMRELAALNIEEVEFSGSMRMSSLHIVGKGHTAVVVKARTPQGTYALKIRRIDAVCGTLRYEAAMLAEANKADIGPKLIASSNDLILMELIEGIPIEEWLSVRKEKGEVQAVLRRIMEQCRRLDNIGLDHGELRRAPKHILIDENGEPSIVDFENASINRNASNVNLVCQFLFIGNSDARKMLNSIIGERGPEFRDALTHYRKDPDGGSFDELAEVCLRDNSLLRSEN